MNGFGVLVGVTALLGWCLMLAVGVLRHAGATDWSLSYDESVVLVALVVDPLLVLAVAVAVAVRDSGRRGR